MFSLDLKDKVVWVTGASRGIGRAIATEMARAGGHVAIGYHGNEEAAKLTCQQVEELGCKALMVQCDVGNLEACTRAHQTIKDTLGNVDVLVNSAGVIADNLFMLLEAKDWQSVLATNVMGVVHTSQLVIKDMLVNRWGRIINISSAAASRGGRGQANYAASKGAVEAMTRSLAVEIGKRGITVNCLAPGVVETDMTKEVIKLAKEEILDRQIIKRFASAKEIAGWAVMLASDYGAFITGQSIAIDGGLKMP